MYGRKDWFFPDAELPPKGMNPDLPGHESIIMLNPNGEDAEVEIVLHWTDRVPTSLPKLTVKAGCVRCVRCMAPDGILGYNTDVDGVVLAVRETGLPVSDALVVGCGGAGRAAAVAALRLGCRVTLANRTPARAAALAKDLACDWIPTDDLPALSPDLVIYTVPRPMDGLPDFAGAVILEANYRTPVLAGRGRAYISGLRWLLYQAVAGYGIFTGETPDADAMFRIFC